MVYYFFQFVICYWFFSPFIKVNFLFHFTIW
jgi:hypothetical protein